MKMSVHHRLWQRYNLQWFIHSSWNGHFHCARDESHRSFDTHTHTIASHTQLQFLLATCSFFFALANAMGALLFALWILTFIFGASYLVEVIVYPHQVSAISTWAYFFRSKRKRHRTDIKPLEKYSIFFSKKKIFDKKIEEIEAKCIQIPSWFITQENIMQLQCKRAQKYKVAHFGWIYRWILV